jgi:hypothetical protein
MPVNKNTSTTRERSQLISSMRWILILPAALLAPLGMWLLLVVSNLIARFIGEDTAHPLWIQIVGSAFLGYYFVLGGAKTAPSRRATTALVLATTLNAGIVGLYLLMRERNISLHDSLWWLVLNFMVTLGGTVVACVKVYVDSQAEGESTPGLRQTLATLVVSIVVTSSILVALMERLPSVAPTKAIAHRAKSSPREEVRERLATMVEETNREIAKKPFSLADCPSRESGAPCLELIRVNLRSDLGIDRHYRVHYSRVNLDQDSEAREAWTRLFGQNDSSFGFYEDRQQLCRGETLRLMRDYGLRIGIIHHTIGGIEIAHGIIDLAACLDWKEKAEASESSDDN